MKLQRYENEICMIDPTLLKRDEYCFFVLIRVLKGVCRLTLTDKKNFVICHSCEPYPVWIWLPDDATEKDMRFVYQTVKENFGIDGRYRFNTKYFFAEYMIERAREDKKNLKIVTNMFAYHCPTPIEPLKIADGRFLVAEMEDMQTAVDLIGQFHEDIAKDKNSLEEYRKKAEALIGSKQLFFWVDGQGEKAAMCSYTVVEDKASLGSVFTRREKRRRGYAANLVYTATKRILAQGKIPILYTDADYAASNACYAQIGYRRKGELCTIE